MWVVDQVTPSAGVTRDEPAIGAYDATVDRRIIARISWDLPHGEERVVWMGEDEVILFGRAAGCQIRMGHVPYDQRVPTIWGKLSWGGRIRVENLAERVAKWSISLVPTASPDTCRDESPCVVSPGMESSLASPQFEIRARAPGGLGIGYSIRVNAFPRAKPLVIQEESPSIIEIVLSPAEKAIGRALIKPFEEGSPVPATYEKVAVDSHYSREGVRDAIGRIDAKFAGANMYPLTVSGTTPERVARILIEQRSLVV